MAINERVITGTTAAEGNGGANEAEQGLILHLDANDVDSYDGDGSVWYDITNHEYKPATNVSEHFNTVTYSGNSSSNAITGVGFQPDLVWIKRRNALGSHYLNDSVRETTGYLRSDTTDAEAPSSTFTSFDSDGFTLASSNLGNNSAGTYVAWCFKAGGAAVSNTDGSITSSVSANNDLGFSIVSYTGTGSTGDTFGHGLDVPVEMVIVKNRDTSGTSWVVSLKDRTGYLKLNDTNALSGSNFFDMSSSSVLELESTGSWANTNGDDYIAYCFASKRGVSKVGSYEGTGVSGNKVYTGFEPAWVMLKNADETGSWRIYDNVRGVTNALYPNLSNAEATGLNNVTFNRDGFTVISTGGSYNGNNETYIYLAFAKDTNETSLNSNSDLFLHYDPADTNSYSGTGTTLTDLVGNNNADLLGGIESGWDEELGNSFPITGSGDGITTSSTVSINPATDGMTIEMWVKVKTDVQNYLFSFDGTDTTYFGLSYRSNTDKITWFYRNSGDSSSAVNSATIVLDEWTHIVATTDGSSAQFYTNGVLSEETSSSAYSRSYNEDLHFGNMYDLAQNSNSDIGQIRFYKGGLSADEVMQNFNFTKNDYPNGYNAALTNMSSSDWNASGYFTFSANTDRMQTSFQPNITVPYSMSVWVNRTDYVTNGTVLDYTQNASPYNGIGLLNKSDGTCIVMVNGYEAGVVIGSNSSGDVYDHIVFVYNGGTSCRTYINGVGTDRTLNATPNQPNSSTNFVVGNSYNQYFNAARMKVSDVRFYDKQLTDSEVTSLYNEGSGVS